MLRKKVRMHSQLPTGAMADIAFLLLIFFLVTASIDSEKGLSLLLPSKADPQAKPTCIKKKSRNILKIQLNAKDEVLIKDESIKDIAQVKAKVKQFVANYDKDATLSETPQKALVALHTHRATHYQLYISILDQIQAAYYELYGARIGLTADEFRRLNKRNFQEKMLYEKARKNFPMNITIHTPPNDATR